MTPKRLAHIRATMPTLSEGARALINEALEALAAEHERNRRLRMAIPVDARRAEAMLEHIDDALEILRGPKMGGPTREHAIERAIGHLNAANAAFDTAGEDPLDMLEEALERVQALKGSPALSPAHKNSLDALLILLKTSRDDE